MNSFFYFIKSLCGSMLRHSRGFIQYYFYFLTKIKVVPGLPNSIHTLFFSRSKSSAGFSTIELLVSIGIFALITGLTLVNYGRFSGQTVLESLAHEVALSVREAQVFGLSVREFGIGSGLFPTYGVSFNASDPVSFFLFADVDGNGQYSVSELVETLTLRKGNIISSVCGYIGSSAPCTQLNLLNITFTRPDPEATITGVSGSGPYVYVRITLSSPTGLTHDVLVWANGQISVQ